MTTHNMEMSEAVEQQGDIENGTPKVSNINMNTYANKKSAAESLLDVALLMANASQLKNVIDQGPNFTFYAPLITLISISLIFQVVVGVLLIFIVKWNLNDTSTHYKLNILENVATACVFVIVMVNVFITAFGVQHPNPPSLSPSMGVSVPAEQLGKTLTPNFY